MADAVAAPVTYNVTFGANGLPAPEKAPTPKMSLAERFVRNGLFYIVALFVGIPALIAGIMVAVWNVQFVLAWSHGYGAIGLAIAAICFSAAVVGGPTTLAYLKDRRPSMVKPARGMWITFIIFSAIGAAMMTYFPPDELAMKRYELQKLGLIMPLGKAEYAMKWANTQQDYIWFKSQRERSLQAAKLDKEIRHLERHRDDNLSIVGDLGTVGANVAIYIMVLLFAAYGLYVAAEASAAILIPKATPPPEEVAPNLEVAPVSLSKPVKASQIKEAPIDWLIPGFLERGILTLLGGDPKVGKSTVACNIAAAVSSGADWNGSGKRRPMSVMHFELEDSFAKVTAPRLIAAGANMDNIHLGAQIDLSLLENVKLLNGWCKDITPQVGLLNISPMIQFFGKTDYDDNTVRERTKHLLAWAADTGVAINGIVHLKPANGAGAAGKAEYACASSFVRIARACWNVFINEGDTRTNDPQKKQRILKDVGGNNVPPGTEFSFNLQDTKVGNGINCGRVVWEKRIGEWQPGDRKASPPKQPSTT